MINNDYDGYLSKNNKREEEYKIKTKEWSIREIFSIWILVNLNIKKIFIWILFITFILPIIFVILWSFTLLISMGANNIALSFLLIVLLYIIYVMYGMLSILYLIFIISVIVYSVKVLNLTSSLK